MAQSFPYKVKSSLLLLLLLSVSDDDSPVRPVRPGLPALALLCSNSHLGVFPPPFILPYFAFQSLSSLSTMFHLISDTQQYYVHVLLSPLPFPSRLKNKKLGKTDKENI